MRRQNWRTWRDGRERTPGREEEDEDGRKEMELEHKQENIDLIRVLENIECEGDLEKTENE